MSAINRLPGAKVADSNYRIKVLEGQVADLAAALNELLVGAGKPAIQLQKPAK